MRRRRLVILAAVPLLTGIVMAGSASAAYADPSGNASCVAQVVHQFGPPGPARGPGLGQFFGGGGGGLAQMRCPFQ